MVKTKSVTQCGELSLMPGTEEMLSRVSYCYSLTDVPGARDRWWMNFFLLSVPHWACHPVYRHQEDKMFQIRGLIVFCGLLALPLPVDLALSPMDLGDLTGGK